MLENIFNNKILNKKYPGKSAQTEARRAELLEEWRRQISGKNYSKAEALLIFDAIIKNLKKNNKNIDKNIFTSSSNVNLNCIL